MEFQKIAKLAKYLKERGIDITADGKIPRKWNPVLLNSQNNSIFMKNAKKTKKPRREDREGLNPKSM